MCSLLVLNSMKCANTIIIVFVNVQTCVLHCTVCIKCQQMFPSLLRSGPGNQSGETGLKALDEGGWGRRDSPGLGQTSSRFPGDAVSPFASASLGCSGRWCATIWPQIRWTVWMDVFLSWRHSEPCAIWRSSVSAHIEPSRCLLQARSEMINRKQSARESWKLSFRSIRVTQSSILKQYSCHCRVRILDIFVI